MPNRVSLPPFVKKGVFTFRASRAQAPEVARQVLKALVQPLVMANFPFLTFKDTLDITDRLAESARFNISSQKGGRHEARIVDFPVASVLPQLEKLSVIGRDDLRLGILGIKKELIGLQVLTKSEFRDALLNAVRNYKPEEHLFLASGDLDKLNSLNKIYGKEVMNVILHDVAEVLTFETEKLFGRAVEMKLCFGGDEFQLLITVDKDTPGFKLQKALDTIRERVPQALERRYGVALLPKSLKVNEDIVRRYVKVLDGRPREYGKLVMFELEKGQSIEDALIFLEMRINTALRDAGLEPNVELSKNWVAGSRNFNDGVVWAPTVSIGAISLEEVAKGHTTSWPPERDNLLQARRLMDEMLYAAEDALRVAKFHRNSVQVGRMASKHQHQGGVSVLRPESLLEINALQATIMRELTEAEYDLRRDHMDLRFFSGGHFRDLVYEQVRQGRRGILLGLEAVYGGQVVDQYLDNLHAVRREDLRGWEGGVGLRGVNKIFGYVSGDDVIKAMAEAIARNFSDKWKAKVSKEQVLIGNRFVDKYYLWIAAGKSIPSPAEISEFIDQVQADANRMLDGVAIKSVHSHLVEAEGLTFPGQLFERLENTGLVETGVEAMRSRSGNLVKVYTPEVEELSIRAQERVVEEYIGRMEKFRRDLNEEVAHRNIALHLEQNYDSVEFAEAYDRLPVGNSNQQFYELARPVLSDHPAILDLGCGTGKALRAFSQLEQGTLVGIDIQKAMIEVARSRHQELYPQLKAEYLVGDIAQLDEIWKGRPPVDVVTGRYIVNYVNLDDVLPQVRQALRPGGKFIFNVFGGYYYGDTEEFRRTNPFYDMLRRAAKQAIEEQLNSYPEKYLEPLVRAGQVKVIGDKVEIIGPAISQNLGPQRLTEALNKAGFSTVNFTPVNEWFPLEAKREYSLLKRSLPFYWGVTNLMRLDERIKLHIIHVIYEKLAKVLGSEIMETDVFVTAE